VSSFSQLRRGLRGSPAKNNARNYTQTSDNQKQNYSDFRDPTSEFKYPIVPQFCPRNAKSPNRAKTHRLQLAKHLKA